MLGRYNARERELGGAGAERRRRGRRTRRAHVAGRGWRLGVGGTGGRRGARGGLAGAGAHSTAPRRAAAFRCPKFASEAAQ